MAPLERELRTYEREQPALLDDEGRFALVQGDTLLGVFDTYADALDGGYDRCGLKPFLVKQISAVERALWFTRDP
jgi:hypothetical protein